VEIDKLMMGIAPSGGAAATSAALAASNASRASRIASATSAMAPGLKTGAVEARQAGYVLPPTMAKEAPNFVESVMSGEAGKIKLQQSASTKNQEVTNRLAAQDLGLPPDTTLTPKVFQTVRTQAGQAYKDVANSVPEITADPTFKANVAQLGGRNSISGQQFPGVLENPELDNFVTSLGKVDKFTPDAGLEVVRKLRSAASKNLNAFNDPNKTALGWAQRNAANEIDDLIERNIQASHPDLVSKYRDARQLIAKSHDIEGATNAATGDVSAKGLARLSNRGRPFTGNLKTIADTANAFPKAMQNPAAFGGDEPYSALDAFAALGSVAAGHPGVAAVAVGRPFVRGTLLKKAYQDQMILNAIRPTSPVVNNPPLPPPQNYLRALPVTSNALRLLTQPPANVSQGQ
jgi:hypothetical protein